VAVSAHDYDRGGKPDIAWHDEVARDALVPALIVDVLAIIDVLPVTGSTDAQERAVALLTLVAGHDVEPGDQPREWRIARARTSATRCDEQMHRQRAKLGRTGTGA
jgi:hypothetical protein